MVVRRAEAVWQGGIPGGKGRVKLGSGAFEGDYSFGSRFENGVGTNPEELIGAAHAGCFSMALSFALGRAGHPPQRISTTADVHLDKAGEGFAISRIDLKTEAQVPGIDAAKFATIAEDAKRNCTVSKALAGTTINLSARLVS
ncbi:MAG TPA: OsmC family protein [Steroidobacteraceae bacterium]|nr:OsmC family protein [Steroidobacteraceae bacterium]